MNAVSHAWLGDGYQMTSQINRVNPGAPAQKPHRDYHLGYLRTNDNAKYPKHCHLVCPALTLQGAVAHQEWPLESGPTMLLPHTQKLHDGYLAFLKPEFIEFFLENKVQLEVSKGDAVFFNPALYHGAGKNTSKDIYRVANLLQIGHAWTRVMESVDRQKMSLDLYPTLLEAEKNGLTAE